MDAGGIMPRCRSAVISHSGGPMRGPRSSFVSLLIVSLALAAGGAVLAQRGQGGGRGQQVNRKVDAIKASPYKDRFRVFANVNWNGAGGPGWKEKALADLEQAVKNGAIGLKIFKGLGLSDKKADSSRLHVDDPDLDPIWD